MKVLSAIITTTLEPILGSVVAAYRTTKFEKKKKALTEFITFSML